MSTEIQVTDSKQYYLSTVGPSVSVLNGAYKSQIRYNIPRLITSNDNILYHTIKLLHAEIPFSFNIINETNNEFVLGTKTITIIEGNYNANTLLTYINNILSATTQYILYFNSSNGRYYMTNDVAFQILNTTTSLLMGLANETYDSVYDTNLTGNKYIIYFPYPCNLLGTKTYL